MKNKSILLLTFVSLFFALTYCVPQELNAGEAKGKVHIIVKGDTLWDLSEEHLGNPFLWPKLWQWNSYISNPHFIYPADSLNLFPPKIMVRHPEKEVIEEEPIGLVEEEGTVEEVADEIVEEVVEEVLEEAIDELVEETPLPESEPEEEAETYTFAEMRSSGFIDDEELKVAGKIVEAEDEKLLLSDGDLLYVTLDDGGKKGDKYTIFKIDKQINHPVYERTLGYKIIVLGFAEITGFSNDVATARITKAFDAIARGDLLKPKEDIPNTVTLKPTAISLDGYITASKGERTTFGERDIVYIDLGKKDGMERGNSFIVYKVGETVLDRLDKEKSYKLPSITIGRLLVLSAKEGSSVAIIIKSIEEMRVGQKIKSELD